VFLFCVVVPSCVYFVSVVVARLSIWFALSQNERACRVLTEVKAHFTDQFQSLLVELQPEFDKEVNTETVSLAYLPKFAMFDEVVEKIKVAESDETINSALSLTPNPSNASIKPPPSDQI